MNESFSHPVMAAGAARPTTARARAAERRGVED
jgi:hypothetical protein